MKIKELLDTAAIYLEKHRPYFRAGIVCIGLAAMLFVGMTGGGDPIAGAYMNYENQTENEELKQLLTDYYTAYAKGDVDALEKLATPISDKEKSYIKLMSKYIKSYDIKEIETKPGVDRDALLISVALDIHYKKLDEAAPGLDFFYVEKDKKGKYVINNRYSTFNAQNGELDVDPTITTLIATFEQQADVIALQSEVTQAFNALTLENKDFNVFFAKTMPEAVTDWAADYKKKEEKQTKKEAKKEAAAKKKAKEEEKKEEAKKEESKDEKTKEETAKQDTEKTDSAEKKTDTVVAKEKVNVRSKPSTDARSLGKVSGGTELTRYKEKSGWSKVDYDGTKAWIKSEFLTVKAEDEDKDEETAKEDSKKKTTAKKDDSKTESTDQKDDDTKSDSEKKETSKKEDSAEKSEAKTSTVYAKEKVNVRTKPSTSAKSLGQVSGGTKLTKYKEKSGWSKVDYNGKKAWIKSEFLTTDKPKGQEDEPERDTSSNLSVGQSVRLSSAVNIRKGMDESADRIALAYDGEHVTVVEVYANGWTKVNYNGKEGYMKTEYVK